MMILQHRLYLVVKAVLLLRGFVHIAFLTQMAHKISNTMMPLAFIYY